MKSKSIILLAVSTGFGLVAAFGISQVLGRGGKTAEAAPQRTIPVLIAKETIDQFSDLTEDNVEVKEWPEELVPEDAITTMEQLQTMVARSRVPKNSPILNEHLTDRNLSGVVDIRPGFKVLSINADKEDLIAGLLQPGQYIDIMAVFQSKKTSAVFARTFLKNVRVFAIDTQMSVSEDTGAAVGATIISVEVTKKQAEKIVLVQRIASLKFVLVGNESSGDNEINPADVTDLRQVFGWKDALAADFAQQDNPQPQNNSTELNPEKEGKQFSMVILGQTGTQTYRWREGELPMIDNPNQQAVPKNEPHAGNSPPLGNGPPAGGATPVNGGTPVSGVKDNGQPNPNAKSGSNAKIPEDEFDEQK